MSLWITLFVILLAIIAFVTATVFSSRFRTDLLEGTGETKVLGFLSVSGATIVTILAVLIGSAIYVSLHLGDKPFIFVPEPPSASEKIVREYFKDLNSGIAGHRNRFQNVWEHFSPTFQEDRKKKFPNDSLPDDYWKLYHGSGNHSLRSVSPLNGSEEEGQIVYYVVFSLNENHPLNPLFNYFTSSTVQRLESNSDLLSEHRIRDLLLNALKENYDVESAAETRNMDGDQFLEEIYLKSIKPNFLNRLIGPRLLSELAAAWNLERKSDGTVGISSGGDDAHYRVLEGNLFTVVKTDNAWKISKIVKASFHAWPKL